MSNENDSFAGGTLLPNGAKLITFSALLTPTLIAINRHFKPLPPKLHILARLSRRPRNNELKIL